ncbi:DNA -binding domain-containing protein [Sphingobium yanoikuyae]|jgi:hypothetical protein|uniref:DNA -binding domain-containing protein n=1 Tax=Sphingobium yanoikuyae TaxID=13690 RepID=UPI0028DCC71F|nr:DUF2285 domain-containing protein [Sphingobium yanoikuyae]
MGPPILANGGCIFAEHPDVQAPDARILWHADRDPEILRLSLLPAGQDDDDGIDPAAWREYLTVGQSAGGCEPLLLSDGLRRIRVDIVEGSLAMAPPLRPLYHIEGVSAARGPLRALNRFLDFLSHRRLRPALYPAEPRMARWLLLLRVHDALREGASHRDIGIALFGADRIANQWDGPTDALRSRVRRLVRDAQLMAEGGYRQLLRRDPD